MVQPKQKGEEKTCIQGLVGGGDLKEGYNLKDPDVDGRILLLQWIFEKLGGGHGLDRSGSGE